MYLAGIELNGINGMRHGLAQSWERKTPQQQAEHHHKFVVAAQNYVRKWGGTPGKEVYTVPYNGVV